MDTADPLHKPAFPQQPERETYEQMREKQLHNGRFMSLFYKDLDSVVLLQIDNHFLAVNPLFGLFYTTR